MDVNSAQSEPELTPPLWRDPFFWLTMALTLFAVAPFLQPGYHWGANDARHHVYFLFEYDRLVQDGIWLPRWSPDFAFGYGYPFFNIYGPLSHFVAELLHHFGGLDFVAAVEAVFVLSIVGSAAAMYGFVRSWGGRPAAVVAALVYVYAPYHLLNLYVRANLAESMAFVWLPLCLWAARQSVLTPSLRPILGLALSYAGLMVTSNLVIVLFSPLLALYVLVLLALYAASDDAKKRRLPWRLALGRVLRRGLVPLGGGVLALGLSAFFWLPAFIERKDVLEAQWFLGRYDFRGNFVYFYQLFSPYWGFGVSQLGPHDTIGYQLGVAPLLLVLPGLCFAWRNLGRQRFEMACFLLAGGVATTLALTIAEPLWTAQIPVLTTLLQAAQFPWRWFNVTCLCMSILSGLIMHPVVTRREQQIFLNLPLLTVIAAILISSYPLLQVQIIEPAEGAVSLAGLMRFQQSSDEMTGSTRWVQSVENVPTWSDMADYYISQAEAGNSVQPVDTNVDYSNLDYNCESGFVVDSVAHNTISEEVWYCAGTDDRRIIFNLFYYPGWTAYLLDGEHGNPVRKLAIIPETEGVDRTAQGKASIPPGRIGVPVPRGEGYVLLRYEDTAPRTTGQYISLASLLLLLVLSGFMFAKRRPNSL